MPEHESTEPIVVLCTVDRFENGVAVLVAETKEEITIPRRFLPGPAGEGSVLTICVRAKEEGDLQQEQTAKNILNQLFGQPSK